MLVIWEISRKERDLAVYVQIRDMHGARKITYGYRRIYNSRTRALERQEADTEVRQATKADGTVTEYSRAGIVREIFDWVTGRVPLSTIENDLNDRGVPSPEGAAWRRGVIRMMAINPEYIGKRVLRGEIVGDGIWDGLMGEDLYWAAVRLLRDPSRTTTRPGRAVHLLSYIVMCSACGGPTASQPVKGGNWASHQYTCLRRWCASVSQELLEEYVQRVVVAWMTEDRTTSAGR